MPPLRALRNELTDDSLQVAILVGLATVPFTLALSWRSGPDDYSDRETESLRAGIWTGLAGSIAVVLLYVTNTSRRSAPSRRDGPQSPSS